MSGAGTDTSSSVEPPEVTHTQRLARLDHVRGLAALCILFFHLTTWMLGEMPAEIPLERGGVFAVSIFYMLSGVSLYHAYGPSLAAKGGVRTFFIRRFFRIFPLLWLTAMTTYAIWPAVRDPGTLFLTISGLFGFVAWDRYTGTGLWSIGNELVFYALFPVLLIMLRHQVARWVLVAIALVLICHAAFFALDVSMPLSGQWHAYAAPWHQLPYFLIGLFLVRWQGSIPTPHPWLARTGMLLCILYVALWPVHGDKVLLVTGPARWLFTIACGGLVLFALKDRSALPRPIEKSLTALGDASYALYMLHPIVIEFTMAACGFISVRLFVIPMGLRILLCVLASVVVAWCVHHWFERFFIALGKRLALRVAVPATG
ncbi:MAG: acyltransferase [Flavobacteriales bacterium]